MRIKFKKSSFSMFDRHCVTVGVGNLENTVYLRNSRDPENTTIALSNEQWDSLVECIKAHKFDVGSS